MMKGTFELADFVFDCDSVDSRDGSYNLCWHRGGRVVGFILPFFVSGGGNAASKIKQIAGVTVDASEIQKVVNVIKQGHQPHHTIKRPGRRQLVVEGPDNTITMTIDEHGKVNVVTKAKSLASNLTGSLKLMYDDLVKAGLTVEEDGINILFKNSNNEIVVVISENKFTPANWKVTYEATKDGYTVVTQLDDGYILLQKGDDFAFDFGFKDGRRYMSDEINAYHKGIGNHEPYRQGLPVIDRYLQPGDKVYIIEYRGTGPNPGGWGSKNKVTSLKEVREDMAILQNWKNEELGELVVREYTVIKPLPVRDGVTGPMLENSGQNIGQVYRGNQQQYEFIERFGKNWRNYLENKENGTILLK